MIGFTTLRPNQRIAIWNRAGQARVVDGPRRVFLFRESFEPLPRHTANAHHYLAVQTTGGDIRHLPGPDALFFDPVQHAAVTVHPLIEIPADGAVVVERPAADNDDAPLERRVIRGPARFMPQPREQWQRIKPQARYRAGDHEYLIIRRLDGTAQHLPGPVEVWFDPTDHDRIEAHPLVPIDANEAAVVYTGDRDAAGQDDDAPRGAVTRRVVRGPAQYLPQPNTWLHQFRWHGADPKNPRRKVPRALRFTKLRVIPDQMYVDIEDVRTADDALLTVQVMIFFELTDIERMLDQTHDPVADFINAATADVIDFAATRAFDAFKRDTETLNDLAGYPQLTARAQRIGYTVNKVVYRGYEANPKLQAMHDHAIEARTGLQLEAETERQAQELADLKLQREAQRDRQQQAIERERNAHERGLKEAAHDQQIQEAQAEHDQALSFKQQLNALEQEHIRQQNTEKTTYLTQLQTLDIDLTRYLVAQHQHPDRLIRIDGGDRNADDHPPRPQVHLHEN